MKTLKQWGVLATATALGAVGVAGFGAVASAHDSGGSQKAFTLTERLSGYHETPLALSTSGQGSIRLRIDPKAGTIAYTVRYANLEGTVTQSHIHFGSPSQTGGISVFLCSNLGNGPAGTPACPTTNPGEVSGMLDSSDVIGPAAQGITAGQFSELLAAIRADSTYANVHSTLYPAGEIRNQLSTHDHH
ncbi:CHRD domain-containing protein [Pedococcus dokdonensis]|uniref:CHRD domain-containing protein n=1 Tax=Pedococcus dokdonensis TaxID=443156 RepID=A0A1H0V0X8_9MICO|nr:CHRD domain-containing protein [Pedococcus dokdonensis]SDP71706.1 CHRD domain-containing protein [Pedococcus dokdonensis]